MLVEDFLRELGCEVACHASRIAKAVKAMETTAIDAAVLDVNVAGESATALAGMLDERGVPFVFASGYGARGVDDRWRARPVLQKPFTATNLRDALLAALGNLSFLPPGGN